MEQLTPAYRHVIRQLEERDDIAVEYLADQLDFVERRQSPQNVPEPALKNRVAGSLKRESLRRFWTLKYALDFVVSIILLLVFAIPMVVIGLLTFTVLGGPIVFWQYRPGQFGKLFKVLKFRSMHAAHDARRSENRRC